MSAGAIVTGAVAAVGVVVPVLLIALLRRWRAWATRRRAPFFRRQVRGARRHRKLREGVEARTMADEAPSVEVQLGALVDALDDDDDAGAKPARVAPPPAAASEDEDEDEDESADEESGAPPPAPPPAVERRASRPDDLD